MDKEINQFPSDSLEKRPLKFQIVRPLLYVTVIWINIEDSLDTTIHPSITP